MRARLFALLGIAALSIAGAAGANSHRRTAALPRIPALPQRSIQPRNTCPIPARFRSAFERAARDTGFQLSMLVAVAEMESRFDPGAQSSAGARGLLQVLPSTAASLKLDADNPDSNVLACARYLKLMLDRFLSTDQALAAYNAGPTAVERAGGHAPTLETATYVANVQQRWRALAGCR
jgi:soluble lytic murein transglycosylase-like protein